LALPENVLEIAISLLTPTLYNYNQILTGSWILEAGYFL